MMATASSTRRELTAEESAWLAAVPEDPAIEHAGAVCPWAGRFWHRWVADAVERGAADMRADGDRLTVSMPSGVYVATMGEAGRAGEVRRRPSFFPISTGGTYASHAAPRD